MPRLDLGPGVEQATTATRAEPALQRKEERRKTTPDDVAAELARGLTDDLGDACVVCVLTSDGRFLTPLAVEHREPQALALLREVVAHPLAAGLGIAGQVLRTRRPVRLRESTDALAKRCRPGVSSYVRTLAVESVCMVPLLHEGRAVGVVGLIRDGGGCEYSPADEREIARRSALAAGDLVTARRRARDPGEHPLSGVEQPFRHGFDTALIGMAFLTVDGRFSRVNQALCELLGRDDAGLVGTSTTDITHPEDIAATLRSLEEAGGGAWRTHQFDKRFVRPDGEVVWVHVSSRLVVDARERPLFFFCQYLDVSERKRTELLLAESQRAGRVGSFEWLPRTDEARWSEEMYRIHGVDRASFGASLAEYLELVHPADRRILEQAVRDAAASSGGPIRIRYRFDRRDGEQITVEVRGTVEADRSGRPIRLVGTCADVSTPFPRAGGLRDPLTGLATRELLLDRLSDVGRGRRAMESWAAVLVCDLDGFSRVNLHRGPAVGDEVLEEAARRIKATLRVEDLAARIAGDRIAVFCLGAEDVTVLADIARRLREALEQPFELAGSRIELTASVGVAAAKPGTPVEQDLLHAAESALRRAKIRGGGCVQFFDERMRAQVVERASLQNALRAALAAGSLDVHYQPLVCLPARRIVGVEALLRWNDERFAHVSIEEVIGVAEAAGIIGELGRFVLARACAVAAQWTRGGEALQLSVNLSPRQLRDADLVRVVAETIERCGLRADCLRLEVTESAAVEDPDAARGVLSDLRDAGVVIALDDFGTGYSSLGLLHALPIQELKVDRSFVAALEQSGAHAEPMISSIVGMAGALGLEVTAEGVETERQLEIVVELGCHRAQGFLIARPMAEEQLTARLEGDGWRRSVSS